MKDDDKGLILEAIECDGFDYAMVYYSDWSDIEDKQFSKLHSAFIDARDELGSYLRSVGIDID